MEQSNYTADGFRIISESDGCPLWEKESLPCRCGWAKDCFFCKYSDFRTSEYRERMEAESRTGKLYSVCHNEKNKRSDTDIGVPANFPGEQLTKGERT